MPEFSDIIAYMATVLGRFMLGGFFIAAGLRHFPILDQIAPAMQDKGIPAARSVLIAVSVFQILAGLLLALGFLVILPALLLAVFTIAASVLMLDFWTMEPGESREITQGFFMSNMGIVGGLLIAAATPL